MGPMGTVPRFKKDWHVTVYGITLLLSMALGAILFAKTTGTCFTCKPDKNVKAPFIWDQDFLTDKK